MTTSYANAAAPYGALFDDRPQYVDCVAVWASGRTQAGRCKAGRLMDADAARAALAGGLPCVYVRKEDVEAVRGDGAAG